MTLPTGVDAGRRLLATGHARLYLTARAFARQQAYEAAAAAAEDADAGLYAACVGPATALPVAPPIATTTNPSARCAPSYPDVCIAPPPPDLDCADVPHRRFRVVHDVASPDPHRFDGDRDGVGCES